MEKTTNYKLPRWEKDDFVKMDDFNDAFGTLDGALKAQSDAIAGKAGGEDLAAVRQSVTAMAQTIAKGKICRIKYGTYTGDGKNGSANPNQVSTDFYPVLFAIWDGGNSPQFVVRGNGLLYQSLGQNNQLTWQNNGLKWYCDSASYGYSPATIQYNASGMAYYYVVLGYEQ